MRRRVAQALIIGSALATFTTACATTRDREEPAGASARELGISQRFRQEPDAEPPAEVTGSAPRLMEAPPCDPQQIRFGYRTASGSTGHDIFVFEATNTSTASCLLRGSPSVIARSPGMPDVNAEPGYDPFADPSRGDGITLTPAGMAVVNVLTDHACAAFQQHPMHPKDTYPTLVLQIGDRSSMVAVPIDATPTGAVFAGCGLVVGRFTASAS